MTERRLTTPLTPELYCSDITISLTFYVQVLGFTIQYQRAEEGFAMLERQGARVMLDQLDRGTTWLPAPLEKPFGRGINLQMETRAVHELYARVQESNATIFLPMEEKWYRADDVELGNRQCIVQDPDGYLLRFFENLGTRPSTAAVGFPCSGPA